MHFSLSAPLQILLLLAALCVAPMGCATGSTTDDSSASEQQVSGEPPAPGEDVSRGLPAGPEVLTGTARAEGQTAKTADAESAEKPVEQPENAGASDSKAAVVSRAQLDAFIKKGPSFPLSMVAVEPARTDGKFTGFRVLEIHDFAKPVLSGHLQTGDVITHLNGVRVQKPDDYLNAWKLLAEVSAVRIDFLRDDQAQHAVWLVQ